MSNYKYDENLNSVKPLWIFNLSHKNGNNKKVIIAMMIIMDIIIKCNPKCIRSMKLVAGAFIQSHGIDSIHWCQFQFCLHLAFYGAFILILICKIIILSRNPCSIRVNFFFVCVEQYPFNSFNHWLNHTNNVCTNCLTDENEFNLFPKSAEFGTYNINYL